MTLTELIEHLRRLGLSEDTIKAMVSTYELGYAQGLTETKQTNNQPKKEPTT